MNDITNGQRPSRKEREVAWRKAEIVKAAAQLFVSKGYEATSLQEIAEASEFSVGTLYNFFENKEDLYFAVLEEEMASFYHRAEAGIAAVEGPRAKLEAFAAAYFDYVVEKSDTVKRFWQEMGGFAWAVKERLFERLQKSGYLPLRLLIPIFEEARMQGITDDVEPKQQAIVFRTMCFAYFFQWLMSDEKTDLASFDQVVVERFLNGFGRR
ncbi:MAG: TetR/AcrR family transcriptional regulator [Candidatus Coatesbacteria bacterium]|nr:TetR/AcrR family transcriptional regulator [Candidatus Coatesbacteria bacterium]